MSAALFNRLRPKAGRTARLAYAAALVVVIGVVVFALNAVYGFLGSSTASSGVQRTATVTVGTVQSSVSASGNVTASNNAAVDFGTSGTITAVNVAVGDHVKAGQVLGTIDPTTAQTTLQAAQAKLAQDESALAAAQGGPTAAQTASNASSLLQAQSSLATAQQQETVDETAVATARTQQTKDQALVCPPAGTSSASAASSGAGVTGSSSSATTQSATQAAGTGSSAGGGAAQTRNTVNIVLAATPTTTALTTTTAATPPLPAASAGQASAIGSESATLGGTVDPSGTETTYHFEYGTSSGALASKTAELDAGSGNTSVSVTADVTALDPGATYYFRVVATSASGTTTSAVVSFATLPAAKPTATSSAATNLLTTTATLNGSVDPNGSETTYRFEYGTTAAYGLQTPAVTLAAGTTVTSVSAPLTGLKADTAYLFRLVATNSSGTSDGIGQIARTAQSSCVADAAAVTSAEQTLAQQQTAVKTAEDNLAQTKATIAAALTPSSATIAQDEATVKQDEATVAADQQALDQTTLRAPIAGTVTAVNGSVGSTVSGAGSSVSHGAATAASNSSTGGAASAGSGSSSTASFVTLASLDQLEIVAGFAEADATKIAVGQPATITFPALTSTDVAGKVTSVSGTSTVVSNVVTYAVTIVLVNPPSEVKEGMTANVSVIDQTRANVLELPSSALTTAGVGTTVQLLQNGKATVTPVTTGLVGNASTEIVSGLAKGDVVVEPTVTVAAAAATTGTSGGGLGGGGGFGGAGGGFGGGGGGFGGGAARTGAGG